MKHITFHYALMDNLVTWLRESYKTYHQRAGRVETINTNP